METAATRLYEGMFLIDSAEAARAWDEVVNNITTILQRAGAEIVSMHKWDERPLAYKISKVLRGTYILVYFRVAGGKISEIEKDIQLSERLMRALILRADHLTQQDIDKETPAMRLERESREVVRPQQPQSPAGGAADAATGGDRQAESAAGGAVAVQ